MSEKDHGRILFLDGWRGLAILTVLAGHFIPGLGKLGGFGVDLFFVLSGRLMAQILIEEKFPLGSFFLRRLSRIYPALFVFATIMLVLSLTVNYFGYRFNSLITPIDYLAALTMWMNYKVAFFGEAGAVGHLWSISVEEHSYIILAFLAVALHRSKQVAWIVAGCAVLAIVYGFVLGAEPSASEHSVFWRTDVRIAPLFLSFAIYLLPKFLKERLAVISSLALIASFSVPFLGLPLEVQLLINSLLLAISVNGLDFTADLYRKMFEGKAIRYVGVTSYSLYLWQQPLYTMHERISSFLLVPAAFVLAALSYNLVEQPARRSLNKWIGRRSSNAGQEDKASTAHVVPELR